MIEEAENDVVGLWGEAGIDEGFEIVSEPVAWGFEYGTGVEDEGEDGEEFLMALDGDEAEGAGGDEFVDKGGLPDGGVEDGGGGVGAGEGCPAREEIGIGGPVAVASGEEAVVLERFERRVRVGDFKGSVDEGA